ncbi:MAG: hypothetical protein DMG14_23520 [Acidobacteria bacterium]|nr:MAG: hypothetical protein DMG14_23520 [Acidobacteriota bacterium]
MMRIRVEYDAYNRRFTLQDQEFGSMLDDGAVYELSLPVTFDGLDSDEEFIYIDSGSMAHA